MQGIKNPPENGGGKLHCDLVQALVSQGLKIALGYALLRHDLLTSEPCLHVFAAAILGKYPDPCGNLTYRLPLQFSYILIPGEQEVNRCGEKIQAAPKILSQNLEKGLLL